MVSENNKIRRWLAFIFVSVFFLILFIVGPKFSSEASIDTPAIQVNEGRLPNYDIREDRSESATNFIESVRRTNGRSPSDIAEMRDAVARGETALKSNIHNLKVEHNSDLRIPEVISSDVWKSDIDLLSKPSTRSRSGILRRFITDNNGLFGINGRQAVDLITTADYTNPDGKLSFVSLRQQINDIPVFRGEIKAGFTANGRIIRIINNLAPRLNYDSLSVDFRDPLDSVTAAAEYTEHKFDPKDLIKDQKLSSNSKSVYGSGDWATTAEKMYFPTEPGVAVPAWRILIWQSVFSYYVIVDASSGTLLWRKAITEKQSAPATFNVYGNMNSLMKTADSPTPFTPGCLDPTNCLQPPIIARLDFTLIGNEAPNSFNNLGWIPDTGLPVRTPADPNITDGNSVEAGIDRDGTNGVDLAGHAVGNPTRVFNFAYNPAPGDPPPGDDPTPPNPQTYPPMQFQQGVTAHGFYLVNRWHDEMYKLGFTEQAGNFQHFNFGRGGSEGDRISLEVQDSTGTNGANFSAPADGGRGRMQNFLWTPATPDRDGTLDSTIVVHEITHGVSGRLHGNSTGLNTNMARGMGEGWSDFYAAALLSEPSDTACGIHALGGYISYQIISGFEANHYYGIRKFPIARIGCLGGPSQLPHNPLTFGNLNAGNCSTFASAYPRGPLGSGACDQVHNAGEIWASALWEMRGVLIDTHGAADGNRRSLQYTTDGMKLSPLNPNYLQARDAIITAAAFSDPADVGLVREGFRRRGMGYSSSIISSAPLIVVEAFDFPLGQNRVPFDFDGDGKTDVSIYRPSVGEWWYEGSAGGGGVAQFGAAADKIVPADYTADGKSDMSVFRPSTGEWFILRSEDFTYYAFSFGLSSDIPASADFDGDGKADPAIFRPTTATWYVLRSTDNQIAITNFGGANDIPVPADYDGDGKADIAIFRPNGNSGGGEWWYLQSSDGQNHAFAFGSSTDKPVPGDYTGDGKSDIAIWRPSNGSWYILRSEDLSFYSFPFGINTDIPAPGHYDGDGKFDAAVFRPSTADWYINGSTSGILYRHLGTNGDIPVPSAFVH